MLSAVVVLALSGLAAASPEADPVLLLNPYAAAAYPSPLLAAAYAGLRPYALGGYRYAPSYYANQFAHDGLPELTYSTKTVSSPAASVSLRSSPLSPFKAVEPIATADGALLTHARPLGPRDCVTEGGCLVKALKERALAKRDADADPAVLYSRLPYYAAPYSYARAFYGLPYYAYGRPAAVAYTRPVTYTHVGAHPVNPTTVLETDVRVLAKREAEAEPEADPAVLYSGLSPYSLVNRAYLGGYASAYYGLSPYTYGLSSPYYGYGLPYAYAASPTVYQRPAAVAVAAPVVYERPAVVAPVVEKHTRPVTYTHIGAHPINPTTVLETDSKVVGHTLL